MANGLKKLDEYNLTVLREQLSLPANKYCFDCHQRGPTYVNVTIGSFVCTSCSGLLRGLTPPHRVKSISMATFNTEEIDFIKSRGNENCQRVWLGMYDSKQPTNDEKQIKDFMVSKYEKKMYYSDPVSLKLTNGVQSKSTITTVTSSYQNLSNNITTPVINISTPNKFEFLKEEPPNQNQSPIHQTSQSFANFDNNPAFSTSFDNSNNIDLNLKFVQPLQTGYVDYLTSNSIHFSPARQPNNINNRWSVAVESTSPSTSWTSNGSQAPSEDRYAALKDLDYLMKSQVQQDITPQIDNSNNSAWCSDAPLNGTWSSQVSENTTQNPFKTDSVQDSWTTSNHVVNPFVNNKTDDWQNNIQWPNGLTTSQSMGFEDVKPWSADFSNPFKVGSSSPLNKHSSNPFL
ncbi:Arf GTPase activating protein [Cinara cedri]|uniref:Arf GTPase activating protein n=1 Tax=Cinara cedri TaxID=506608 RepID=A0A5E4MTG7_9HEMI|nr:Arf GTPase activating protein [Cinara cedri]